MQSPPTTFVRVVLIADVATGAVMYASLDLDISVPRFASMSLCGSAEIPVDPRKALFLLDAPPSEYPDITALVISARCVSISACAISALATARRFPHPGETAAMVLSKTFKMHHP